MQNGELRGRSPGFPAKEKELPERLALLFQNCRMPLTVAQDGARLVSNFGKLERLVLRWPNRAPRLKTGKVPLLGSIPSLDRCFCEEQPSCDREQPKQRNRSKRELRRRRSDFDGPLTTNRLPG